MNPGSIRCGFSFTATVILLTVTVLAASCGHAQNTSDSSTASGVPAGYTLVAGTDAGKKLAGHKAGAITLPAAIQATLRDLATVLDAPPTLQGAFADSKTNGRGGASFTGKLNGHSIKGFIFCNAGSAGADSMVTYCRTDAPAAAWDKLTRAAVPATAGSGAAAAAGPAPANIKLETYTFPDGTGSIGLPAGWKTSAQTVIHGIVIEGPTGQIVVLGLSHSVNTPDSFIVQNQIQMIQNARRMGFAPPPPIEMLVAPYTGPLDAMKNVVPQLSQISQRHGGPATVLTKLLEQPKPAQSGFPNGQAAWIYFAFTRTAAGAPVPYRAHALLETWMVGNGAWSLYVNAQLAAPDATFDHDLPVMVAITQSLKTDSRAVQQATNRAVDANNQFTKTALAANAKRQAAFDDYLHSVQRNSVIQSRAVDNFDEAIRGNRTVEDTRTGERHSVDLGHVDNIVDELNQTDPGRYIQIPLRDEMDPLPPEQRRR